jgi:hypothetical protein
LSFSGGLNVVTSVIITRNFQLSASDFHWNMDFLHPWHLFSSSLIFRWN